MELQGIQAFALMVKGIGSYSLIESCRSSKLPSHEVEVDCSSYSSFFLFSSLRQLARVLEGKDIKGVQELLRSCSCN
jgi:hypothetical protein